MANTDQEWELLKTLVNVYQIGGTMTITLRDGVEGVASEADGPKPSLIISPSSAEWRRIHQGREKRPVANKPVHPGDGRQHRPQ